MLRNNYAFILQMFCKNMYIELQLKKENYLKLQ